MAKPVIRLLSTLTYTLGIMSLDPDSYNIHQPQGSWEAPDITTVTAVQKEIWKIFQ